MLKLEQVKFEIDDTKIIKNISVNVQNGEFIIIIGQNGAGKSSLLELIAGTQKPSSGSITLEGQSIGSLALAQRAKLMSRLYQQPARGSIGSMTVRENCALALYKNKTIGLSQGLACLETSEICERITKLFPNTILDARMDSLSGGQRQLISFIMATAQKDMKLLLLDEPTAALDFNATQKMLDNIENTAAQNNVITIMVTHDFDIATSVGTRLWVINDGKLEHDIVNGIHKKLTHQELKQLMI